MNETTLTAKLPHLDVEMTREEPAPGRPEVITMRLTATPSMEAFADHLTNPAVMGSLGAMMSMNPLMSPQTNPMMAPMMAWGQMVQSMWAPFLPAGAMLADKSDEDDPAR